MAGAARARYMYRYRVPIYDAYMYTGTRPRSNYMMHAARARMIYIDDHGIYISIDIDINDDDHMHAYDHILNACI
jgi:hypothetical protein